MTGEINGDTDAMREFVSRLTHSMDTNPVSPISRRGQTTPCGDVPLDACQALRDACDELTSTDNDTTGQLHEFMSQVEQGFATYSSFVQRIATTYDHADEQSRANFFTTLDSQPGRNQVAIDPRLER
ncbi:hypothetical protein [Amycolatopsis samaneae]|uniref:Uncharacterized protein n=1 Tax=Amycolatopsis samaneae TaxID=664691 RepID=A0ABW5GUN4_9PSEU